MSTLSCLALWSSYIESAAARLGFRAFKKALVLPYSAKVNNRIRTPLVDLPSSQLESAPDSPQSSRGANQPLAMKLYMASHAQSWLVGGAAVPTYLAIQREP